jgi:hypothetical protein
MRGLPALRRQKDTATELSEVSELLSEIEPRIARLEAEKIAALGGEDYVARTLHINEQIAALSERRGTYVDRRRILEQRLRQEQQEFRVRRYQEAVDRYAAQRAPCVRAARELEKAIAAVAAAARKFIDADPTWPVNTYYPPVMPIYADRLTGKLAESCFAPKRDPRRVGPPGPEEFLKLLLAADVRAAGFGADVADLYDAQLAELRASHVPEPEPAEPDEDELESDATTEAA